MNTWGISGTAFLTIYGTVLVVIVATAVVDRLRGNGRSPAQGEDLDDYDIAVLNGEAGLAASVALVALDRAGAVELGDRMVRDLAVTQKLDLSSLTEVGLQSRGIGMEVMLTGPVPEGAHPVERAVYEAVVRSRSRRARNIRAAASELPAVEAVRARLAGLGLVRSSAERDRLRRQWTWFVPLLLLGILRLGYGLSRGKPVLYLVGLLALTVGAMIAVRTWDMGSRTKAGDRLLAQVRQGPGGDRPRRKRGHPDHGASASDAGRLLALSGDAGLWAVDRPLALAVGAGSAGAAALEVRRRWGDSSGSSAGAWWGAGCGSSTGGGGGDGGGGGGGGCGGGGGGCGG